MVFDKYYEAIIDVFNDEDIIVGYSSGCVYAMLLAEKLEAIKKIGKVVLIDGILDFVDESDSSFEETYADVKDMFDNVYFVDEEDLGGESYEEFLNKETQVIMINSNSNFDDPTVNSPVVYLGNTRDYESKLYEISTNAEFVLIDSDHRAIIEKDVDKIIKYLK